ncbi:unnamed protein product [Parascedosporium putredinis]|uniref:Uncharacterized protein n=1 Tax=Parascedosporium putredinis TaxID=1442378 RepID=A0A9P1GTH6_9PEZI|nr:unnamed protein product [Parascedosporium putredinis]CAI7987334.1 unnamed protein product [Parascedosporium putredinis]
MDSWRWRPSVEKHSFRFLIIVPVVLAVATAATLFIHSDYNLAAVTSGRAFAVMAEILSFVAGLLTVYTVEGARICNAPNVLIAYPTGPLLIFNMIGGAFIWQLLIIPAFFHRARAILKARGDARRDDEAEAVRALVPPAKRFLAATISSISSSTTPDEVRSLHLESHRASLALVYAAPDDRLMMTRKTLGFIEIDIVFTGFTVLYWLLVEAGWQVVAVMLGVSVVLGPGAGICAGWVYREGSWHEIFGRGLGRHSSSLGQGAEEREGGADEQTPLLG